MANALFLLLLTPGGQGLRINGADALLVGAVDAASAIAAAQARFPQAASSWAGATVVGATDWEGWKFDVSISGGAHDVAVSSLGSAANHTIDLIAADLVAKLNADANIAGASYNASTNTLTAAAGSDGLGDSALAVTTTSPSGAVVTGLVGTITSGGLSTAALTAVLPADTIIAPGIVGTFKQV